MGEIELINNLRQTCNMHYDKIIQKHAYNNDIGLIEFRTRARIVEESKRALNEELDFMIMLLIRMDFEEGEKK